MHENESKRILELENTVTNLSGRIEALKRKLLKRGLLTISVICFFILSVIFVTMINYTTSTYTIMEAFLFGHVLCFIAVILSAFCYYGLLETWE